MDVEILNSQAQPVLLEQSNGLRIAFQGVNSAGWHQAGNLESKGSGAPTHIPDKGIWPRAQVGQQHHPQFHRCWTEPGCVKEDGVWEARSDEIPVVERRGAGHSAHSRTVIGAGNRRT